MQLFSVALLGLVIIAASLCAGRTASSSSPLRLDSPSLSSPVAAPPSLQFKRSTAYKEPEHPVQIDRVELALQGGAGQIESAADPGSTTSTSHKRKRCIYIGTFFHVCVPRSYLLQTSGRADLGSRPLLLLLLADSLQHRLQRARQLDPDPVRPAAQARADDNDDDEELEPGAGRLDRARDEDEGQGGGGDERGRGWVRGCAASGRRLRRAGPL